MEGGWAWLDVALVGGLAILVLSMRLHAGATFDTERSPHHFMNRICIAGLTLTVTWLVLGKSRLILRGLPLLLTLSCVIAVRYMVWADRPVQVWRNTMWTLVPVLYALLICLAGKLLRIEFVRQLTNVDEPHANVETPMAKTFQLRHLLVAIGCIAAFLVTLRPLMPTIASIGETQWLAPNSFQGICVVFLFGFATLCPRRWVFSCAVAVALVTVALLATDVLWVFIGSRGFWSWTNRLIPLGFTFSTSVACTVVFLLPYRLRGWRIRRRRAWQA
jgi:hypothetical protein